MGGMNVNSLLGLFWEGVHLHLRSRLSGDENGETVPNKLRQVTLETRRKRKGILNRYVLFVNVSQNCAFAFSFFLLLSVQSSTVFATNYLSIQFLFVKIF